MRFWARRAANRLAMQMGRVGGGLSTRSTGRRCSSRVTTGGSCWSHLRGTGPGALPPPLLVARGDLDLAVQTSGQVWDFAATSLIVAEAGGVYSGLDGRGRAGAGASG